MTDSLKAALWTSLFTFAGTVLIAFVPFLTAVGDWLNGDDPSLVDDWSVFSRVIVSAFVAAVTGIINWGIRFAQAKGKLPGAGPEYTPGR